MPPLHLLHVHIPKPIPYQLASHIQSHLLNLHILHRQTLKSIPPISPSRPPPPPPPPTVLTFVCAEPTYTVGRRYLNRNPLPKSQIDYLSGDASLILQTSPGEKPSGGKLAAFHTATRGGDLTYHAPGQLTAYPILNLRTHHLTARQYVSLLERIVIRTAAFCGVPNTTTTCNPGVWILNPSSSPSPTRQPEQTVDDLDRKSRTAQAQRKLCALGIQVGSGGLTSHGLGLNVHDPPLEASFLKQTQVYEADAYAAAAHAQRSEPSLHRPSTGTGTGYLSWGFQRIVACGLEGKSTTWLTAEGAPPDLRESDVATLLAESLTAEVNAHARSSPTQPSDTPLLQSVRRMPEHEVAALLDRGRGALARDAREKGGEISL